MKSLLTVIAITLLLATAHSARAGSALLKATVTGTVQTEIAFSSTDGRIHTAPLDNKRIFQEFQVSPKDYALVVNTGSGSFLELVPKSASAMLPTIEVAALDSISNLVNTKTRIFKLQGPVTKGAATNLFKNIAGQVDGTAFYKGAYPPATYTKLIVNFTATGTDPGTGNTAALLKFKVTTLGAFVQQP